MLVHFSLGSFSAGGAERAHYFTCTINTHRLAAPFFQKSSLEIRDAAYLSEHLEKVPYISVN